MGHTHAAVELCCLHKIKHFVFHYRFCIIQSWTIIFVVIWLFVEEKPIDICFLRLRIFSDLPRKNVVVKTRSDHQSSCPQCPGQWVAGGIKLRVSTETTWKEFKVAAKERKRFKKVRLLGFLPWFDCHCFLFSDKKQEHEEVSPEGVPGRAGE